MARSFGHEKTNIIHKTKLKFKSEKLTEKYKL